MNTIEIPALARGLASQSGRDGDGQEVMAILFDHHVDGDPHRPIWWIARYRRTSSGLDLGSEQATEFTGEGAQARMAEEWGRVCDVLADSRARHAGRRHQPIDYTEVLDALAARGLTAVMQDEGRYRHLVVGLVGDSAITITGWRDTLPYAIVDLEGWRAQYVDLSGEPADRPVYDERTPDPQALADGIAAFLADRDATLADEAASIIGYLAWAECADITTSVHGDGAGTWVIATPGTDTDGDGEDSVHLRVATYPGPERGIDTGGRPVTGWTVTAHLPGQNPATAVVYDAPADDRFLPLVRAITHYLPPT